MFRHFASLQVGLFRISNWIYMDDLDGEAMMDQFQSRLVVVANLYLTRVILSEY